MILSPTACKHGMPQINELLQHPFFKLDYGKLNGVDQIHSQLKFSVHIKDQLKAVANTIESRLKSDQKSVSIYKFDTKFKNMDTAVTWRFTFFSINWREDK